MDTGVFRMTVLGTRGSMAVDGPDYMEFGGATSCYMVQAGGETVFLDAGSGLLGAPSEFERTPVILLSHLHLDHLLGLGMYPRLSRKGQRTRLLVPVNPGEDPLQLLDQYYAPPFWPLSLSGYSGENVIEPLSFPLQIGEMTVDGVPGNHPGGCAAMRVSCGGRSLVYLTDYEYSKDSFERMTVFAEGADLILYDGQYTAEEAEQKKGFGHSTAGWGMELMRRSGARRLLLVHHDPQAKDAEIRAREAAIHRSDVRYARKGDVISL